MPLNIIRKDSALRVLIANTLYPPQSVGGAERSVAALAESLARSGMHVAIVCIHNGDSTVKEVINGVCVYRLPVGSRYWPYDGKKHHATSRFIWHFKDIYSIEVQKKLEYIIKFEYPDIIHTNNLVGITTAVWAAASKASIPVLHTLRDYSLICPRTTMFKSGHNCGEPCFPCHLLAIRKRHASKGVKGVIGVSEHMLKEHLRFGFFSESQLRDVQFNGVDASRPNPAKRRPDMSTVRLGFVGRISRDKGVETLLAALEGVALRNQKGRNWTLNLFGTGEASYLSELKQRWPDSRIIFNGHVELDSIYADMDVVVVPSIWNEPLSRVLIEALWRGIGVIASDVGGSPELIGDNRIGRIFRAGDVEGLSMILSDVLQNGLDSLPRPRADDPIFHLTAAETVSRNYIGFYNKMLLSHSRRPTP